MLAPVTDLARWNQAVEVVTRANLNAWITLTFVWPRVMLRTTFGI